MPCERRSKKKKIKFDAVSFRFFLHCRDTVAASPGVAVPSLPNGSKGFTAPISPSRKGPADTRTTSLRASFLSEHARGDAFTRQVATASVVFSLLFFFPLDLPGRRTASSRSGSLVFGEVVPIEDAYIRGTCRVLATVFFVTAFYSLSTAKMLPRRTERYRERGRDLTF